MAFTAYGNGGFDMLSRGLGMLGQDVQNYQQTQKLADLGQSIQGGNYKEAAQKAFAGGDIQTGLSLLKLGQANEPDPYWNKFFGGQSSDASAQPATSTADPSSFVTPYASHFLAASNATGVDPRIVAAQAFLESGGGKNMVGNNLFGIKSTDGSGVSAPTTEYVNGQPTSTNANFAAFATPQDSVKGYADFINNNPRYAGLKSAKTFDDQIAALGSSGYATDPNYAASVRSIAQKLDPSLFQATGQAPGNQVASTGNFLPRSLGPAPAAANDDPPVTIPGFKGTWTRASAGATEAEDSPEVSQVAAAQGKPAAADTTASANMTALENARQLKEAGITYYLGRKSIDPTAEGRAKGLELQLNDINQKIKDAKEQQDKAVSTLTPAQISQVPNMDPNYKGVVQRDAAGNLKFPDKALSQVTVDQRGETAEQQAIGQGRGKALVEYIDAGRAAREGRAAVDAMKMAVDASRNGQDITTGPFAETVLGAKQALSSALGIQIPGTSAAEVLQKMNTYLATAAAKSLTSRPAQMEFMQYMKSNPGLLTSIQGTNVLLDLVGQNFDKQAALSDIAAKSKTFGEFLPQLNAYEAANPIRNPFPSQQQQQLGGPTQTGQAAPQIPPDAVAAAQKYKAAPGGQAAALAEARAAIAGGKDPGAVAQRLRDLGIDPSGL